MKRLHWTIENASETALFKGVQSMGHVVDDVSNAVANIAMGRGGNESRRIPVVR